MNHCLRHYEEPIADRCRSCNHPFCGRCLVYAFGPKKPPYCVGCALTASGVRNGHRPVVASATPDRKLEKARRRMERDAAKAAAKAEKKGRRQPEPIVADAAAYAAFEHDPTVPPPAQLAISGHHRTGQPL